MAATMAFQRSIAEQCPDAVILCQNGRIAYVNAGAVRLFGVRGPELLLRTALLDHVAPPHRPAIEARLVARPHMACRCDIQVIRADGDIRDVELTSAALFDDEERPEAEHHLTQWTLRDVTEARLADAGLRISEERLRLAFAGSQEGVWDWNLGTGEVVYSQRWKEMLGYRDEEIEPHVRAWEQLLSPDDREQALQAVDRLKAGEDTYRVECRLRHKAGHYVHVLSRGFPVRDERGTIVRIVGTHLDLTERKRVELALRESEERLRLAFTGAQEGVWDWNVETGAVVYSHQWKQMLGYGDDEIEPHVSAWERLLHPDDRPHAGEVNRRVIDGHPAYEMEFRLRHKNGHYVHVLSRGLPIRRPSDGRVVRIVGTHFDLTERKRAEEALRRAHEELEQRVRDRTADLARTNQSLRQEMEERQQAERARTELLGRLMFAQEDERRRIARDMHDRFGEHLTALTRRIELLGKAAREQPVLRADVDALERVAQRLDRDVEHLVWELRPTALDDLGLRAALSNYVRDWSQRVSIPAHLHTSGLLDDRLPPEVETTLYRIAQEALTNAARHSRASNVDVILERRPDAVILIVEDNGVGFEPNDDRPAAHGFGLLGMQERAALVGASVQIESSPGHGTTVLVRISRNPGAADHGD